MQGGIGLPYLSCLPMFRKNSDFEAHHGQRLLISLGENGFMLPMKAPIIADTQIPGYVVADGVEGRHVLSKSPVGHNSLRKVA